MRVVWTIIPAILLAGCVTVQDKDLGAGLPLNSDKSLWSVTDVPQVGSILRLNFADAKGTNISSSSLYSAEISQKYTPQNVAIGDSDQTLTANNGLKLGISFVAKGAPNANADLSNATTLKLKLTNVKVAQYSDLMSFQNFMRGFDGAGGSGSVHELYAQINAAGKAQRATGTMTPYWVVTKVFTADNLEYSVTKKGGVKASAGCGSDTKPCVVPTSSLTASVDLSKDTQSLFKGSNRPIFVVIRPIGVNSQGNIYIEEDAKAPAVIAS